jgi:hypothetical protein
MGHPYHYCGGGWRGLNLAIPRSYLFKQQRTTGAALTFVKGEPRPANAGRRPGSPNKTTRSVRDALVRALEATAEDGGEEFFTDLRDSDPKTFATLVSKLIPNQTHITGDEGGPVVVFRDYTGGASGRDSED